MPTITFRDGQHTYTKHSIEDALILLEVLWDNFSYRLAPARNLLDAWCITPERVDEFLDDEDEDEGDKKALRNLADLVRDKLHGNWNAQAIWCTVETGDYGHYWTPEDMPPREALEKALIGHNLRIEEAADD